MHTRMLLSRLRTYPSVKEEPQQCLKGKRSILHIPECLLRASVSQDRVRKAADRSLKTRSLITPSGRLPQM